MTFKIFIPVKPVPASRPRISQYGNYYPKTYTDFRKELFLHLKKLKGKYKPVGKASFSFELELICYRPKKPSNDYPRGDCDNYCKGYMDGITYAQILWEDDIQVTEIKVTKRYQEEGEDYGANITVKQLTRI